MMNFTFPADSETPENGMSTDEKDSKQESVETEGDGNEDPLSSALHRLTDHFVKRINRLKIT